MNENFNKHDKRSGGKQLHVDLFSLPSSTGTYVHPLPSGTAD